MSETIKIYRERIKEYADLIARGQETAESAEWRSKEIERYGELIKKETNELEKIYDLARKPLTTDEERVEIIMLVTNNDRDLAIKAIEGVFLTKYPFKLTIYENTPNTKNTSKIWNKLIKESVCGYVMLIDSDAFPQNDCLTEMMKVMKQNPRAAVVGSVAGNSAVTTIQQMKPKDADGMETDGHISGYCMLFRRSIFEEIGYFDEDFYFYGQESDWIEKILEEKKYKVFIAPRAHVIHGLNGEASISSRRLEEKGEFNRSRDSEYAQVLWHYKKAKRINYKNPYDYLDIWTK